MEKYLTKEEGYSMINKSLKSREGHDKPSKETLEKFNEVKEEICDMKKTCANHNSNNSVMAERLKNIDKNFEEFKDNFKEFINEDKIWKKEMADKFDGKVDKSEFKELSIKVNKLENWKWWLIGIGVGLGLLIEIIKEKIINK